ncbi:hypothetical protein [Chitinophaga solisilvae]|uniref:hypothetical protein n=1 Tax=Chitinophaga solisilvae TaxID=1233460 RepID=UPI001369FF18|nr:hypothetical protein [Chitinophaga solisilvae]
MNKRLLLLILGGVILTCRLAAQNIIAANRLLVRDSVALRGYWIRDVNNDSLLEHAGAHTISTDGALKKYIKQKTSKTGNNEEDITVLHAFRRNTTNPYLTDQINLKIISADSIVTPVTLRTGSADLFTASGKAPFSITGTYINRERGTVMDLNVMFLPMTLIGVVPYNTAQRFVYYRDTLLLNAKGYYGTMSITASWRDSAQIAKKDTLVAMSIEIVNNTPDWLVTVFANIVPPMSAVKFKQRLSLMRTGSMTETINLFPVAGMSDHTYMNMMNNNNCQIRIFKNGTETGGPATSPPSLVFDTTWKEVKIIVSHAPND